MFDYECFKKKPSSKCCLVKSLNGTLLKNNDKEDFSLHCLFSLPRLFYILLINILYAK